MMLIVQKRIGLQQTIDNNPQPLASSTKPKVLCHKKSKFVGNTSYPFFDDSVKKESNPFQRQQS
ncbi:hypothetical protein BTO13_00135 [Polaribacter gangjinensis]|uniref:Uncharacterized protein n=1 Tax=Polaribacter gangjinensis TaxID=574710 RepID=A0A2S7W824_9FLAO|nr:hypothetical protein BTO13_00135 [Polaribacter gangjinensis]